MTDFLASVDLAFAAAAFAVVALATLSLAFLWEGVRRWVRNRAASRALRKLSRPEAPKRIRTAAGTTDLLREGEVKGPEWLEPLLLRLPHREDVQRFLDQAGIRWSVGSFVLTCIGTGVAFGLVASAATRGVWIPMAAAGLGAYLPVAYLRFMRRRRFQAFEEHFAEAIDLLARAARAGHSLATGLQVVAEEAEEPVAAEFRQVYEEQRFGLPLNDTLLALGDRVDLVDVRIFVTAVLIQRESGGNLAENLDGLSRVIRGRFRFKREVKTKTAHGRMTGIVVGLAPVVTGIAMYTLNPDYMRPLLSESLGRLLLGVGAFMMLAGFLVIRRMVDVRY